MSDSLFNVTFPPRTNAIQSTGPISGFNATIKDHLRLRFALCPFSGPTFQVLGAEGYSRLFSAKGYDLQVIFEAAVRLLSFLMEPGQDGVGGAVVVYALRRVTRKDTAKALMIDTSVLNNIASLNIVMYLLASPDSVIFLDRAGFPHSWSAIINPTRFEILDNSGMINVATLPQVGFIINDQAHRDAAKFYLDRLLGGLSSIITGCTPDTVRFGVGAALGSVYACLCVNVNGGSAFWHVLPSRPAVRIDPNTAEMVMMSTILQSYGQWTSDVVEFTDVVSLYGRAMVAVERYRVTFNIDKSRSNVVSSQASKVLGEKLVYDYAVRSLDVANGEFRYLQGGLDAFCYPSKTGTLIIDFDSSVVFKFDTSNQTVARLQFNLVSAICMGLGRVYVGAVSYNTIYTLRSTRILGGTMNVPGVALGPNTLFTNRIVNPFCNSRRMFAQGAVFYRISFADFTVAYSRYRTKEYVPPVLKGSSSRLQIASVELNTKVIDAYSKTVNRMSIITPKVGDAEEDQY